MIVIFNTYKNGVDILLLPPLKVQLQLDFSLSHIEVVGFQEPTIKVLIEHKFLDFVKHFVIEDLLNECCEFLILFL